MAKDLKTQLSNRCIHFTGLMNDCCKAGVLYKDVKIKPQGAYMCQIPCIKTGGFCEKFETLTEEQAEKESKEIEEISERSFIVYAIIKTDERQQGDIDCPCGGKVKFTKASSNGHIWCKCNKCDLAFNE